MAKGDRVAEPEGEEPQTEAAPEAPPVQTDEEIKAKIQAALDQGDFAEVKKLSGVLAKGQVDKQRAETEAKQAALKGMTESLKLDIQALIQVKRDSGELEKADHVKFLWVFADNTVECSLVKSAQAKTRSGAGSGKGQKFDVSTDNLLKEFGHEAYKDTGLSHQEFYDQNTGGNPRFQVRLSLLKIAGYIA